MSVFNKTNDALIVDTFKNVFQRRSSEVFKPDILEFRKIQKYMLHCQYSGINLHTLNDNNSNHFTQPLASIPNVGAKFDCLRALADGN